MFYTPEQKGLSQSEIDEINERLWKEAKETADRHCPDCGVAPGENHLENCDVARCQHCGGQRFSCDSVDTWDGLWPGVKECYEKN